MTTADDFSEATWRQRLQDMLADLEAQDLAGAEARRTVALDQQAVGRLSRMDALQGQAMAQATQARRAQQRRRILAALERVEEGEFGWCADCGERIAKGRLDLDPTLATCVSCAKG